MKPYLIEAIVQKLGYPALQKINPNASDQNETRAPKATNYYLQAIVTSVLAGLYKFLRTEDGASILAKGSSGNWLASIFKHNTEAVILRIANYGHMSTEDARIKMQIVATEAFYYIKNTLGNNITVDAVKTYMVTQRQKILAYLPAELQMGEMLHDETVDDRTNKMEGPVSSFMHNMGAAFSGSSDEKITE